MLAEFFEDKSNLRHYYAGQAIAGLLANGRLLKKPSAGEIDVLLKEAFHIADAMVQMAAATEKKPKAGPP